MPGVEGLRQWISAEHRALYRMTIVKEDTMKIWFTSLNGAVTLSALALLSFIGYTLMEMRYFLGKWIPGDGAAMVETIVVLIIVGGWLRALFVAANGRRGGLVALLAFSVFNIMVGLYDLQFVFPSLIHTQ